MLKKIFWFVGVGALLSTNFSNNIKAEWIKDQQDKWVYYENTSELAYDESETSVAPIKLPQYYQADARWGGKRYGLSNLKITGCVPTSLAMAITALKEDVTPVQVADHIFNVTDEMNTTFTGTSSLGAREAITYWGLKYKVIDSKDELEKALKSGHLVFGAVGHGLFVNGYSTHAILLSGYDNGKTKAIDPDNPKKTDRWYDVNTIWNERSLGPEDNAIGGPFMVIYK